MSHFKNKCPSRDLLGCDTV